MARPPGVFSWRMSCRPAGVPPAGNNRRPEPTTTGAITNRISSTSPAASIDCPSRALPWIWRSRPGRDFKSATCPSTSPDKIVVGDQAAAVRVWEATYFGRPFMFFANGSSGSVMAGQSRAKFSYVRRPNNRPSARSSHLAAIVMNSSSMCGTNQPPPVNPSVVSSSGDPGPWQTPSRDTNCMSVSFIGWARLRPDPRAAG